MEKLLDFRYVKQNIVMDNTKDKLKNMKDNETLEIIIKDEDLLSKLQMIANIMDKKTYSKTMGSDYYIRFYKDEGFLTPQINNNRNTYDTLHPPLIIMISKTTLGNGSLGEDLMFQMIKSLKCLETLPKVIIFYNEGVLLLREKSKIFKELLYFYDMGVHLYGCKTSLEYYDLTPSVKSIYKKIDMVDIISYMAGSGKVINI